MKKTILVLLSISFLLGSLWIPVMADTSSTVGYSSARVVKREHMEEVVNILHFSDFPTETEYKITTPEGLEKFSELVDNFTYFSGVTVYLANDLDMSEVTDFTPIGCDTGVNKNALNGVPVRYFSGTFDGQGNMIENLRMSSSVSDYFAVVALFGVNKSMTVKNLVIGPNCSFTYSGSSDSPCVAAIAAKTTGSCVIENCYSMATVSGGRFCSGMVSRASGALSVRNCTNTGNVSATQYGGGMAGYVGGSRYEYVNCRNTGDITVVGAGVGDMLAAGGIVACQRECPVTITFCINNGDIVNQNAMVEKPQYAGGIAGVIEKRYTIRNCVNYGMTVVDHPSILLSATGYLAAELNYTNSDAVDENNLDKTGTQEADLVLETIQPDYAPVADTKLPSAEPPESESSSEQTDEKPSEPTLESSQTDESSEMPTTESATSADSKPSSTQNDSKKEKGCASSVGSGYVLLTLLLFIITLSVLRKKRMA